MGNGVFVITNTNGAVWGHEAFTSADVAEQELRHFFKRDLNRDKFRITELELRDAITGDYAGMVADELNRKYPKPVPAKVEA